MDTLTSSVLALVREAAERAILPRYRSLQAHEVSTKSPDDMVTIADHEAKPSPRTGWRGCCLTPPSSAKKRLR